MIGARVPARRACVAAIGSLLTTAALAGGGLACSRSSPAPAKAEPRVISADAREPRGTTVVTTSDPCGFLLDMIYFEQDSSQVSTSSLPTIEETAEMMTCTRTIEGSAVQFEVTGHADPAERDQMQLAWERAQSVAAMLTARGAPAMTIRSAGSTEPLDRRGTEFARAKNRRVQFAFVRR